MSNLVLLPTLDRLGPYDDNAAGVRAFGLTLSVALSDAALDSASRRTFLQPWTWPVAPSRAMLIPIGDDGAPLPGVGPTEVTLRGPTDAAGALGAGHAAWLDLLGERFQTLAAGGDEVQGHWTWPLPRGGWDTSVEGDRVPWSVVVGELALLPWPLAQSLNLSYAFRARPTALAPAWVAAPILPAGWLGPDTPELTPVPCGVETEDVRIEYVDRDGPDGPTLPAEPAVVAFARPVPHAETTKAAFFDLDSLWVRHPGAANGDAMWRDDWRATFDDRLAEGLRVSALLIERIDEALASGAATDVSLRDALPDLARRAVGLLADLHGPGVRRWAPGDRLAGRLLDADGRPIASQRIDRVQKAFYGASSESFGERSSPSRALLDAWAQRVADVTGNDSAKVLLERPATLSIADLLARWRSLDATLSTPDAADALFRRHWRELGDIELAADLRIVDLHRQLRRDHLGLVWREIGMALAGLDGDDGGDLDAVRVAIREPIARFLGGAGRFGGLPSALRGDWLDRRITSLLGEAVPRPNAEPATRRLRGLTLQVDTVAPDPGEDVAGGVDLLERIQGVGVYLRRDAAGDVPATPWLPLHLGRAVLPDDAIPPSVDPDTDERFCVADRVLLPSRLVYSEGLRDATLTYDNAPIGLEGPLARGSGTGLAYADGATDTLLDPSLRFVASPGQRIPGLAYGATYQAQPFLVTTNGASPKALLAASDGELPWGLAGEIDRERIAADAPAARTVEYRRRTPVGPLRPVTVDTTGRTAPRTPFSLPAIPEGVVLRGRELPTSSEAVIEPEHGVGLFDDTVPCLLLVDPAHRAVDDATPADFRFAVRPPAIDLETWDRFLALDAARPGDVGTVARARRQRVWESLYEASIRDDGLSPESTPDRSLDDPAVDRLEARLWRLGPDGVSVVDIGAVVGNAALPWLVEGQSVDRLAEPDRDMAGFEPDLAREQRDAIGVRVEIADREGLAVEGGDVVVRVVEGQVYRLTLGAAFDRRTVDRLEQTREEKQYGWTSPWHLAIEVAEPLVTAGRDGRADRRRLERLLWTRLEPQIDAAIDGRLCVELGGVDGFVDDGSAPGAPTSAATRLARHALRAELRHQRWAWRGRAPLGGWRGHPAFGDGYADLVAGSGGKSADQHAQDERDLFIEWELAHLGDRDDFEHRRLRMHRRRDSAVAGTSTRFVSNEALESGGARDLRAGHHRFGVRVWSRYAPILRPELGSITARDVSADEQEITSRRPWRSLFVPCRFDGDIPTPKVRAVLPLTDHRALEADDADRLAPGWLVVLDEPWFEVGGLAESLEVEAAAIIGPDVEWGTDGAVDPSTCDPGQPRCRYLQIGPDPIYTGDDAIDGLFGVEAPPGLTHRALDGAEFEVVFDQVHGPAGHHRDANDRAPRVLASSFVVRPPWVCGSDHGVLALTDPEFWMVQVRFRRRLVGHDAQGTRVELGRSEPTAPIWIQLLPSVSRADDDWFGRDVREATVRGDRIELDGASWLPTADRARSFSLYAVFTRRVVDVTGRNDQEVYVGVTGPIVEPRFTLPDDVPTEDEAADVFETPDLWLRLMEIQHHPTMAPLDAARADDTIWRRLFDPTLEDRDRGRLMRMSEPIRLRYPSHGSDARTALVGAFDEAHINP